MPNANHTTKQQILTANESLKRENCELYNKNQQLAADNEKLRTSDNHHRGQIVELQSDRQTEFTNIMFEFGVIVGYEPTIDDVLKRAKEVMAANQSLHNKNVELEAKLAVDTCTNCSIVANLNIAKANYQQEIVRIKEYHEASIKTWTGQIAILRDIIMQAIKDR